MDRIKFEIISDTYNNTIYKIERYTFSPAIILEFSQVDSKDNADATHRGVNQFRIDYTRIGRFECEFSDNTFSYRGENEITLLATTKSPDWVINASIPSGVYRGCALIILMDKLSVADNALLIKLGVDVNGLIKITDAEQRWQKLVRAEHMVELFDSIYRAHAEFNSEILYLRSLEILVYISQNNYFDFVNTKKRDFFSLEQVNIVKQIHNYILLNYDIGFSFESLIKDYGIGYSVFNKVFKTIYGESPYQYLKKIRVNIASKMLLETDMNILEISSSVGYENPSKFSNAFRAVTGVLPRTFRKEKRNGAF
jgi:AraC-like DNA-binding protein